MQEVKKKKANTIYEHVHTESRQTGLMSRSAGQSGDADMQSRLGDGEGKERPSKSREER